jgi:hypothetical protein
VRIKVARVPPRYRSLYCPISLDPEKFKGADMFGHPGISALEFAGEHQRARKTLSLKGKAISVATTTTTTSTKKKVSKSNDRKDTAAAELESPKSQEEIGLQRRRGTFINHTPRNFELRSPKRTEFPQTVETSPRPHTSLGESNEDPRPGASHQPVCGHNVTASSSEQLQPSILGFWTAKGSVGMNNDPPVELDSREVVPDTPGKSTLKMSTSRQNSFASSLTSRVTGRTSTAHSSPEIHPSALLERSQPSEKRHRRQTPYNVVTSSPKSNNSRFSSLEPWVAHHRRQGTSSTISDLPPQVEIDDIVEVSTFKAIQAYFDSQVYTRSTESASRHQSSSPPNIPLPSSPVETQISSPPVEPTAIFPADELEIFEEPTPPRSLARLETPSRVSSKTVDADFASAAEGQYSPYDEHHGELSIPKHRGVRDSVRAGQAGRARSSTFGRMAPPILGHAALTATADLNYLSCYLKNGGPPSDGGSPRKEPALKKIFKVPRKKTLAARVGSVEGHPSKNKQPPALACAREMRTASGARHLRIVVPTDTLSYDHTITLPVSMSNRRSRHVSITWTDEMLNPLASAGLEHAITNFNDMGGDSAKPRTRPRTPKRSPVTLTPVPEEDHPLKSREEKTKARKLRDLKRMKRYTVSTVTSTSTTEDTTAGSSVSLDQPPAQMRESPMKSVDERREKERPLSKTVSSQHRALSLQRQNTELAEALAKMMGLEMEDGHLEADVVLKTYRQLRFSKDTGWDDLMMNRN